MIVSTRKGFLFVHVPKTAGSSIAGALRPYCRPRGRSLLQSIMRRLPVVEHPDRAHFRVHDPARKIIAKLSRPVFDSFESFACVRNPFDHAVSHYEWMKNYRIKSTAAKVAAMSFSEYLDYRLLPPSGRDTLFARMPSQSYFLQDDTGKIAIKRLIRFETLQSDFARLCDDLGLEATLGHEKKSIIRDKKPTWSYFTDDCVEKVRRIYAPDFDNFGYSDRLSENGYSAP